MSSYPGRQFRREPVAPGNTDPHSWLQVFKRALEQSSWKRKVHTQPEPSETVKTSSSSRTPKILAGLVVAVLLLVAIPIALIIRAESHRTHYYRQGKSVVARGESLLGMNGGTSKPKPSPYKYTLATPITRPSNPIVITPPPQQKSAPAVAPQIPTQAAPVNPALPQMSNTLPPAPAATPGKAPIAPIVYPARHDKHFGGCSGQLTLNSAGLSFRCAEDPGDSIQVALAEVGAVDDNGIQTVSGKKYHFTIPGMSKPAAQQLFANWLHQVR